MKIPIKRVMNYSLADLTLMRLIIAREEILEKINELRKAEHLLINSELNFTMDTMKEVQAKIQARIEIFGISEADAFHKIVEHVEKHQ